MKHPEYLWIGALAVASGLLSAAEVPEPCRSMPSASQLDCLQDQQEMLQHVLDYERTRGEVERLRQENQELYAPAPLKVLPAPTEGNPEKDANDAVVTEQIAWFDQALEVYAVVGSFDARTAYVRLEGREYRLRSGDALRGAQVIAVHPRGIQLSFFGHEIDIGLSTRNVTTLSEGQGDVQ